MTREFLERYQGILADIAAIKAERATDTVQGSSPEFPWGFRQGIPVEGVSPDKQSTLERLYQEKAEIELFIEGVEDDTMRAVLRYKIIHDLTWDGVSAKMKGRYSSGYLRWRYHAFWKNSESSNKI